MLRKLTLALAILAMLSGTALAHPGHVVMSSQQVKAGPYTLTVEHNVWPIKANTNVDLVVQLENEAPGTKIFARVIPPPGTTLVERATPLISHAQLPGTWTIYNYSLGAPGEWRMEFQVEGPQGRGVGALESIPVEGPPGLPLWMGWTLAFLPVFGFAWFILRERSRVRRAIAADGGARA